MVVVGGGGDHPTQGLTGTLQGQTRCRGHLSYSFYTICSAALRFFSVWPAVPVLPTASKQARSALGFLRSRSICLHALLIAITITLLQLLQDRHVYLFLLFAFRCSRPEPLAGLGIQCYPRRYLLHPASPLQGRLRSRKAKARAA